MIPTQITIEGFLCYNQKQVIDLTGMDLCMLSGPNGSGKSSVFDAVTIALFNTHRAGKHGREDLINKKCNKAVVELEFDLKGSRYQARRTLSRSGGGTQVIRRWVPAKSDWEIVPDTNSSRGYAEWVQQHVGVSAETFMSSMLLRQGQADRLLTAKPAERAELLGTVVGLDQYRQLHERVMEGRKHRKAKLEILAAQLDGLPQISEEQLARATAAVEAAKVQVADANAQVERLQPLLDQSTRWVELQKELETSEAERRTLDGLLSRGPTLLQNAERLRELDGVLPKLRHLLDVRGQRVAADAVLKDLAGRQAESTTTHTALKKQIAAMCDAQAAAAAEAQKRIDRERAVATRVAELGAIVSQASAIAAQQQELKNLEIDYGQFGPHPDKDLDAARAEMHRLTELNEASPWLKQLFDHLQTIRNGDSRLHAYRQAIETGKAELTRLMTEMDALARDYAAAETTHGKVQAADAQAHADLKRARADVLAMDKANGQTACPTCGHALTPEHLAEEKIRRQGIEKTASDARAAAAKAVQAAAAELERLRVCRTGLETRRTQLDKGIQDATREYRVLGDAVEKAVKNCRDAYLALAQPFRDRVGLAAHDAGPAAKPATWLATAWPSQADLADVKAELGKLPEVKSRATKAQLVCVQWNTIRTKIETLTKTLASQPALADVGSIREEHARLVAEQATLQEAMAADRAQATTLKSSRDALESKANSLATALAKVGSEIAAAQARIEGFDTALAKCSGELPASWADAVVDQPLVNQLHLEDQRLRDAGTEEAERQLKEAQARSQQIGTRVELLGKQISTIAAKARQQPSMIQSQLEAARNQRAAAQAASEQAAQGLASLQRASRDRAARDAEYKQLDREHRHYELLSDLLGREGLQRHLMRQAEKAIVGYANAILDPISNGDLLLRLRGSCNSGGGNGNGDNHVGEDVIDDDDVLDLMASHNRICPNDAIPVSFLSGSQQFRVAVALALAIGQYAGGGSRVGECVIIDEGFGSLDAQGQDVMIEELRQLKGIMKRIILVSHQESFANAFPSGYRFSIQEGQTHIERIST